ncbi:hypothetical protein [Cytobacillus firmus]|uniref:hypothetical protein n=1 Tax=Cytobacillus firmus TaxID=1399 RepID=UPI001CFD360A|nr:hypothetical protein [Cytobacillus firmus]
MGVPLFLHQTLVAAVGSAAASFDSSDPSHNFFDIGPSRCPLDTDPFVTCDIEASGNTAYDSLVAYNSFAVGAFPIFGSWNPFDPQNTYLAFDLSVAFGDLSFLDSWQTS